MSLAQRLRNPLKRAIDIIGAASGLIVLSPLIGTVWLSVRSTLGSPAIFTQPRPGKDGRIFTLYKFRTMLDPDPSRGLVTNDQRITTFGRRLRSTSLDELPTLVNVLRGEMSLVGPRPLRVQYLQHYTPHQARRHEVRPGVTGLAQVHGRNQLSWEERFDLDVQYVDQRSFVLDLKIIARTITSVLSQSGVEGEGTATMSKFLGTPPDDGLTEQVLSDQWQDLRDRWQRDALITNISCVGDGQRADTRYWVYFNEAHVPVGIGGLTGLGGLHLDANILMSPEQQDDQVIQAVLNRLMNRSRALEARRIALWMPGNDRSLHHIAQNLGFVPSDGPRRTVSVPHAPTGEYSYAFAEETEN